MPLTGPRVRNCEAFCCLIGAFGQASRKEEAQPSSSTLAQRIGARILGILKTNPVNYFLLESTTFLLQLGEKLESFDAESQVSRIPFCFRRKI
jgi:hypothetical protein